MCRVAKSIHSHAYDRFRVIMGVTIAHGLVHCFMNYLFDGDETWNTPTEVMGIKFLNANYGDSGSVWEIEMLGGKFMTYKEPDHPLADDQAGKMWLNKLDGYVEELRVRKEVVADKNGMLYMLTPSV